MPKKLNPKQQRFVEEYPVDFNGTLAVIRSGYSKTGAAVTAVRLLRNPNIQAAITAKQQELSDRTGITQARVLQELALVGFSDMEHYVQFQQNGQVLFDWSDLPDGATKVISEITQDVYWEGTGDDAQQVKRIKFKLHSKLKALELIAKHLGMLVDRVVVTDPDNVLLGKIAQLQQELNGAQDAPTLH